jgi:thiamine pyrophosphokinase
LDFITSLIRLLIQLARTSREVALMTEQASTSETSVNFHHSTWRYIPEDSHLHTHRLENLKFQLSNVKTDTVRYVTVSECPKVELSPAQGAF